MPGFGRCAQTAIHKLRPKLVVNLISVKIGLHAAHAKQHRPAPPANKSVQDPVPCFPFPVSCLRLVSCVCLAARALYLVGPGSHIWCLASPLLCLMSPVLWAVSRVACLVCGVCSLWSNVPRASCLCRVLCLVCFGSCLVSPI